VVAQDALFAALGYDNAGRRTSLSYSNGTSTSYNYDVASRLTNITHNGPSSIIEALTYSYDAGGNRVSATRANGTASLLPSVMASASYDAANEQTQLVGATLTYDANGNLTNDGVNTYQWDARNRLLAIAGGASANFSYDVLGRRTSKSVNGVASQFVYDGSDIAAEIGGGAIGANYLRSSNIDEPFIRQAATISEHYHTDALGSSLALSNAQGASASTYTYEPFGKTTVSGASSNPVQYTGRENDGTGLSYYRARYYSPRLQRFISEDPIEFAGGDVNLYAYVYNNPVRYVDLWGLKPGDPYPTADAAAINAIMDINPTSISEGREYAGRIYQRSDGTYSYTPPNPGTKDRSYGGPPPKNTKNQGHYHTHGGDDPIYDNENFSPADKRASEREGVPEYLGTPKGKIKKYIPKNKNEITLRNGRKKMGGRKD
jgi:RHS repeat-associated protein